MTVHYNYTAAMPQRDELTIDWWRHALEIVPYASAFVDVEGRFLFANQEWCQLVQRTEAGLQEMTWREITPKEDIGASEAEQAAVVKGTKVEYYASKHYLLPGGAKIPVGVWVSRHPVAGAHEGFVIFAEKCDAGATAEDVRRGFEVVRGSIAILEEQARGFVRIAEQIRTSDAVVKEQIASINARFDRLENAILSRSGAASVTVGGDYAGHDHDRSVNKIMPLAMLGTAAVVGIAAVIALIVGGILHYQGGGQVHITPPTIPGVPR